MSAANTGGYWTGFRTPEATVGCCRAMGFELWCSELYRSQVENLNLSVRDFNVSNFCVTKLNVPNFSDALLARSVSSESAGKSYSLLKSL